MVTKEQAETCRNFKHLTEKDSRGKPVVCRVSGSCRVWKTRPNEFKLPVKYGLRTSFYITNDNADKWEVI